MSAPGQMSDRVRDLVDELAHEVVEGDQRAYVETTIALLNIAGTVAETPANSRAESALAHLAQRSRSKRAVAQRRGLRAAALPPSMPSVEETIYADPVFQQNLEHLVRHRRRIVGGQPTKDFPDCVAVGNGDQWCCSGTLVAPNVVVTAAHCEASGCCRQVLFGDATDRGAGGRIVDVADVHVHDRYVKNGASDLAALVLSQDVTEVEPRLLATREELDGAPTVRLVGFGTVDPDASYGYGTKRVVDVAIASSNPTFGADPELEFVAGSPLLDRDSCGGDSGGPAYVETNNGWRLGGATSRATESAVRLCGDGGIYERMHAFAGWLCAVPGARFAGG